MTRRRDFITFPGGTASRMLDERPIPDR